MPFGDSIKPASKKRGLGCAGCGCGLLLFIAALIALGFYEVYHSAVALTDPKATPVPQVDSGPDVYATSRQKITAFQQAMEKNQPATLRLDSDEINTAIARDPSMAAIRGKVFVKLKDDEATIQTSVPLGTLENVAMTDRYVHCDATFSVAFNPQDKSISVDLRDLSVKGASIPGSAYANFNQTINSVVAAQIQQNGPARDFLARTQKIAIENGELIIETK